MSDLPYKDELEDRKQKKIREVRQIVDGADGKYLTDREQRRYDRIMDEIRDINDRLDRGDWLHRPRVGPHADYSETETRSGPAVHDNGGYTMSGKNERQLGMEEFVETHFDDHDEGRQKYRALDYMIRGQAGRESGAVGRQEQRAAQQTLGTDSEGGFTVPTEFEDSLRVAMKDEGTMREIARTMVTDHGRDINWPSADDSQAVGELVGEASTIATTTSIPFSEVTLQSFKYQSGPILLSRELLQDSAVDIVGELRGMMNTRLTRITEQHYATNSTGATGPNGINTDSTGAVGVAQGSSNLTFDDLKSLKYSIEQVHRQNATWQMTDNTFETVSKIQDSNGNYLIQQDVSADEPQTLLGHDVQINPELDDFGSTGNKPVFFGDFSRYLIRDVSGMEVIRDRFSHAEEGNVRFLAFMRSDGRTISATTRPSLKPYRAIVQTT